jgi:nicotinamidase-related amidase
MQPALALILALSAALAGPLPAAEQPASKPHTALLLIDIQDFYFPGGAVPLVGPNAAAKNAGRVLAAFRSAGRPVVHVRHDFEPGGSIHDTVAPIEGERVFTKTEVSCFNGTAVLGHLRELGVERLVIAGMQTHMCLEAATRAAHDLGFECVVIADACATRDLSYGDSTVKAADVHAATLATLDRTYATVTDTATFLEDEKTLKR